MDGWVVVAIAAIIGVFGVGAIEEILKWRLKVQELHNERKRLEIEERVKTDEMNAKILQMDNTGASAAEVASLAQEVRQLRQEVAQLRQEISNRIG